MRWRMIFTFKELPQSKIDFKMMFHGPLIISSKLVRRFPNVDEFVFLYSPRDFTCARVFLILNFNVNLSVINQLSTMLTLFAYFFFFCRLIRISDKGVDDYRRQTRNCGEHWPELLPYYWK